jgi:3-deoxy-D-manno-octulosonic acid kinase
MVRQRSYSSCHLWQCDELQTPLADQHFDLDFWRDKPGYAELSGGRGATVRIILDDEPAILRRYYRGGLVGKFLTDQYLWLGKAMTRPWREWQILDRAYRAGLPVPKPVAACVCRRLWWYHAAIITGYLANTETLAARLQVAEAPSGLWYRLGQIIRQLQEEGICHPDLTVTNILIDDDDRLFIIDFDNARIKPRLDDWQWRPLHRLKRSFDKFNREYRPDYAGDDWQALMDGYQG